ncbi:MAG TPA: hypothetical protein VIY29_22800 [Ktedonobacteraceae bacterium]
MKTHPKEYNTHASWIPQQHQDQPQHAVGQRPKAPLKMPKTRVLALANTFKKWLAIASIVSFGTFSGLVAFHHIGTSSTQTSSGSTKTNSATSSSSQNSNNFLNQQGGNTGGAASSSATSTSSTPVTGTSTS